MVNSPAQAEAVSLLQDLLTSPSEINTIATAVEKQQQSSIKHCLSKCGKRAKRVISTIGITQQLQTQQRILKFCHSVCSAQHAPVFRDMDVQKKTKVSCFFSMMSKCYVSLLLQKIPPSYLVNKIVKECNIAYISLLKSQIQQVAS